MFLIMMLAAIVKALPYIAAVSVTLTMFLYLWAKIGPEVAVVSVALVGIAALVVTTGEP